MTKAAKVRTLALNRQLGSCPGGSRVVFPMGRTISEDSTCKLAALAASYGDRRGSSGRNRA